MIRVLVVEDEPVTAAAHAAYVERLEGFTCVASVPSGREALVVLEQPDAVDLVLLDLTLADGHGLQVLRAMRAAGSTVDVIAITAARDLAVVRSAVALGVVQYLLKPFTFAGFRDKLTRYAAFERALDPTGTVVDQSEVDRALGALRGSEDLPKGLSEPTRDKVLEAVQAAGGTPLSAAEVAGLTGTSRVTARRYLEHLVDRGALARHARYGTPGRPETEYRLALGSAPTDP